MKILKEKKFNAKKLINSICDYGLKLVVVLIFFFLFIGRISPGWISEKMSPDKSIVKSAFFFKNYVSEIVALDSASEFFTTDSSSFCEAMVLTFPPSFSASVEISFLLSTPKITR